MRRVTPLQLVIVRDVEDPLTERFVDIIRQAFEGTVASSKNESLYFSEASKIGIPLLDPPQISDSRAYRRALLGGAQTTIAVEIRSRHHQAWPEAVEKFLTSSKVKRLSIDVPPQVAQGTIQMTNTEPGLVEPGFVPVVAALAALESCRRELINKTYRGNIRKQRSKMFISHAKSDGVAMAHALVSLLNRVSSMPGTAQMFDYFYDAESIQPGETWRTSLKNNAKNCVFIALRTEEYENRYWCRQEFLWAERNHTPILILDLRREMFSRASQLPLEGADTARITDGNIVRVLFHALRCHIAHLSLLYRVNPKPTEVVLPRYPSSVSIDGACEMIEAARGSEPRLIVYAGSTLPDERSDAIRGQLRGKKIKLQSQVEWEMANA